MLSASVDAVPKYGSDEFKLKITFYEGARPFDVRGQLFPTQAAAGYAADEARLALATLGIRLRVRGQD